MADVGFDAQERDRLEIDAGRWSRLLRSREQQDGVANIGRTVQNFGALVAGLAALGLWVVPGSDLSLDLFAMKAALTIFLLMLAVALRSGGQRGDAEVQLDFMRKELRVVDCGASGEVLRKLYRFSDLGAMKIENNALHVQTKDGAQLAVFDLDAETEALLTA